MKITTKLLATVIMAVFCCSIAKAQLNYTNALTGGILIYSNAFSGSATADINGIVPSYVNPSAATYGGSASAAFLVVTDNVPAGATAFQNGTLGGHDNSVVLPLTPTNGFIYNFAATLTYTTIPVASGWGGIGYGTTLPTTQIGTDPRISALGGNPWTLLNFGANGGGTILEIPSFTTTVNNLMNTVNVPYVINLLVDMTTTNMVAAEYVAGTLINTHTYVGHPNLVSIGYSQTTTTAGAFKWGPITVSAVPLAIVQQPASANVDQGAAFTNTVVAGGTSPFAYQWYSNGVALVNGGSISGATTNSLIISSMTNTMAGNDYYCVVTNVYGAVTSSPASLGVYTTPLFLSANPVTYTNLMTLFGGSGANLGSSPSFSVSGGGLLPLSYFWQTNGVTVGGSNGLTFAFTNCQMGSPTNFSCIVSNGLGTATNTWAAQYIPTPTAAYPQAVLADGPVSYWRLDEPAYDTANQLNDGEVCNDFMSGNNGIYTNTALGLPGYYVISTNNIPYTNDPTETAAAFGLPISIGSDAFSVGTNVDFSASTNAEFTVAVWANGGIINSSLGINDTTHEPANSGIVAKGGFGLEEFALDNGGSGGTVRFMVRNAVGAAPATPFTANSTLQLGGDPNWHLLVGVCDESNGLVNLYVDGLLTAQGSITKNSGLLASVSSPITIGADAAAQFNGALDDVAIFPYALNANQVNALYHAPGGVNPLTFTAPVPSTNQVWRVNQTLTIPATALGTPPLGYYWTNLTVGGIVSGAGVHGQTNISAVSTITCTLTITNAAQSWSGDQLELVVTNATASTNMTFNLFAYPLPITIGYTNSILYSNQFNGGTWNISGTATTVANQLVGGTNSQWTDVLGTNDTTGQNGTTPGEIFGNGLDNSTLGNSWIFPFTPEPGFVYTETAVAIYSAAPGNWIGEGFAQNYVKNTTAARFDDNGPNGMDWILLQPGNGNVEFIDGMNNSFVTNANGLYTSGAGTNTMVVVLDTTQPQWTQYAWINGVPMGTNVYSINPAIGSVGITQNSPETVPNNITWNYWSLTAVSPNGFPPYLLNAITNSAITLTNATITFTNVTGYGTGPWGYSWINNSTVLSSGTTNNTAPNTANLSIATSSLSAGQLQLVLTNALGTNISTITLNAGINANPTNIVFSAGANPNQMTLSWPSDHTGWQLQAQTNSLSVGINSNWVNVAGSTTTNKVVIPINLTNGTVFYRLMYQ